MIRVSRPALAGRFSSHVPRLLLAVAAIGLGAGGAVCAQAIRGDIRLTAPAIANVKAALKVRLPKTPIDAIRCQGIGGLCEVTAGESLFYVDPAARFLMIGHVYDMEARSDITAARLLQLDPAKLVGKAQASVGEDEETEKRTSRSARVDLAALPTSGGISWGPVGAPKLVVLSDFACGYCRKLTAELARLEVRVEEHPISIFGAESRRVAEQVLCAADPVKSLHAAYRQEALPPSRRCDVRGLDANEAFARQHGFGGTPVLIRGDGAVLEGYRPAVVIQAFLDGKPA